jgi:hypothetical protein
VSDSPVIIQKFVRQVTPCAQIPLLECPSFKQLHEIAALAPAEAETRPYWWKKLRAAPGIRFSGPAACPCGHFSAQLALAAPAGVDQGQRVFVSKHNKAIQDRRNSHAEAERREAQYLPDRHRSHHRKP